MAPMAPKPDDIPTPEDLIAAIDALAEAVPGLTPKIITRRAVGNPRLYRTLKSGGGCGITTAATLLRFIERHTPNGATATASPEVVQ